MRTDTQLFRFFVLPVLLLARQRAPQVTSDEPQRIQESCPPYHEPGRVVRATYPLPGTWFALAGMSIRKGRVLASARTLSPMDGRQKAGACCAVCRTGWWANLAREPTKVNEHVLTLASLDFGVVRKTFFLGSFFLYWSCSRRTRSTIIAHTPGFVHDRKESAKAERCDAMRCDAMRCVCSRKASIEGFATTTVFALVSHPPPHQQHRYINHRS